MMRLRATAAALVVLTVFTSCTSFRSSLLRQTEPSAADRQEAMARDEERKAAVGLILDSLGSDPNAPEGLAFVARSIRSVQRANADLTPRQEYYLGRAFGAQVLTTRKPLNNDEANRYLNLLGQSLARYSERPDTWAGYRFQLLDTPEVNAFAAPGGFIFVTRGLVKLAKDEDQLAAVLAHEIAHIELEHGLKAIRKDRLSTAMVGISVDAAQTFGGPRAQELSAAFEDSIGDLTKTIVNNGYARETEFEADASAVDILDRAGYPPQALLAMLESLKTLPKAGEGGFTKTHPTPEQRIKEVKGDIGRKTSYTVTSAQKRRFQAALGRL